MGNLLRRLSRPLGILRQFPYRGSFQGRPEEIRPGSIAEAFLADEEPGERLQAIRDASEFYRRTMELEAEYVAFLQEAAYYKSQRRWRTTDHVLDTGDPLYRAVWRGREWIVMRDGQDASRCGGIAEEVWVPVPPDFQNPHFIFREGVWAKGGRPVSLEDVPCKG